MSEIHWEKPVMPQMGRNVIAFVWNGKFWVAKSFGCIVEQWGYPFTAWMEMPPAPVKPKRFVVEEYTWDGVTCWRVYDAVEESYLAYRIPTPEAAQRIADIYEEVVK